MCVCGSKCLKMLLVLINFKCKD